MALTDVVVRNARPKGKRYRINDERGLCLEIAPAGGKWWRLRYSFEGKEKYLSLGTYPDVTLKDARDRRDEARKLLAQGVDPSAARRQAKAQVVELERVQAETFEALAREWFAKQSPLWVAGHSERVWRRLEADAIPWLGPRPVREITAPEILSLARRMEARGAVDGAHRLLQTVGQILRYCVATGRSERNPVSDLKGALAPIRKGRFAALTTPREIGGLLRAIDGYQGSFVTLCALRLAPLTFVRPGELRQAEWSEIDLDAADWRIPAEKMKMREAHVVPLSNQAVEILQELQPLTGAGRYLFPSMRTAERCMSENTVNAALRRLGFAKDEMTGHGFRAMASTVLNEQGWRPDIIEKQLAHVERNAVRAAYHRAEYLPERRKMMQAWADYLDGLRTGAKIIPIQNAVGE